MNQHRVLIIGGNSSDFIVRTEARLGRGNLDMGFAYELRKLGFIYVGHGFYLKEYHTVGYSKERVGSDLARIRKFVPKQNVQFAKLRPMKEET